ncbi:MAG TPA: hypothetical protein VFQ85_03995 [Mycobacteriales bacterium]|jgi:hypothetical protein|nr:hypothetical protein [Mycobacteriales bacterium]
MRLVLAAATLAAAATALTAAPALAGQTCVTVQEKDPTGYIDQDPNHTLVDQTVCILTP